MRILKFNNFLNEKMGVAEASLIFIPFLKERIEKRLIYFVDKSNDKDLSYTESIRFNSLKDQITDVDLWLKFPVVGFDVKYNFVKYDDYSFNKDFPITSKKAPLTIGGGAQSFGNKNWKEYSRLTDPELGSEVGIILFLEIDIHINVDSFDDDDSIHMNILHEGLDSTLYHEMNHFYEMYYRTRSNKTGKTIRDRGSLNTCVTVASSERPLGIPENIVDYWMENFVFYTYLSEDFELRSHVQEMDFYFKEHPQQSVKESRVFKYYDQMSKFVADDFYLKLKSVIKTNWVEDGDYVIDNMKNYWVSKYKKEVKSQKATPIFSIEKFENMSGYDFIKWWEPIIREKGEYVKRKIYKLASSYNDVSKK